MKLRELFEEQRKVAVAAFGRMNPPTIGHEKLVNAVKDQEGDHYIFLSQTQKPKTDPLPFDVKLEFAKKFFPGVNVGHPTVRTPIQMLQMLEQMGYTDIIYVAGSDRVESFTKLFNDYNGKEYNFKSIEVVSAGERDPDADGAEGMSASKMRAAAASDDYESFAMGTPNPQLAKKMYDAVRTGMGIKNTVSDKKEGVSEGDYPDGSSLKTPSPEEWQKEYEKAKMAVKNAKTQQEYEAASDRASRIKDLLASKGIKVGPVLGKEGIDEASDFGEPREILEDVLRTLEREVEWPLTDVMDPLEVKQLLAPVVKAVNDKLMKMSEAQDDWGSMSRREFKRRELDYELGHETNNVSIDINGKPWKVLRGESENPRRALARAEKIATTIKKNAIDKGRPEPKVDVYITGAPATE